MNEDVSQTATGDDNDNAVREGDWVGHGTEDEKGTR
jgi:hypothetical protein